MPANRTPKTLEIRLRIDLTGGGNISRTRLEKIVDEVAQDANQAVERANMTAQAIEGEWSHYYGPWYSDRVSYARPRKVLRKRT